MIHRPRGTWPYGAAIGAAPVSALARRRPGLWPLAALFWHQTEEWVWPGEFLPWMNREILGADEDEIPIDRRLGLLINAVFGWGLSLAALAGPRGAAPTAVIYTSHLGNAALHVGWAARHRRYDPGVATAVGTLTPVAVIGLYRLATDPAVDRRQLRIGVGTGVAVSVLLVPGLKLRLRAGRR